MIEGNIIFHQDDLIYNKNCNNVDMDLEAQCSLSSKSPLKVAIMVDKMR